MISLLSDVETCAACGKPIALVNLDKLRGVVGMTYGYVHITRHGHINRWVRHRPIPQGWIDMSKDGGRA